MSPAPTKQCGVEDEDGNPFCGSFNEPRTNFSRLLRHRGPLD